MTAAFASASESTVPQPSCCVHIFLHALLLTAARPLRHLRAVRTRGSRFFNAFQQSSGRGARGGPAAFVHGISPKQRRPALGRTSSPRCDHRSAYGPTAKPVSLKDPRSVSDQGTTVM